MECKAVSICIQYLVFFVLIETLWNVKKGEKGEKGDPGEVLIETLWNVK